MFMKPPYSTVLNFNTVKVHLITNDWAFWMDIDDFLRFLSHTEVCEIKHLVSNPLKNNRFFWNSIWNPLWLWSWTCNHGTGFTLPTVLQKWIRCFMVFFLLMHRRTVTCHQGLPNGITVQWAEHQEGLKACWWPSQMAHNGCWLCKFLRRLGDGRWKLS